ncbi:hypothetical protein [Spirosoma sp. KCTC 42546]|uniref:hypothetical protein n=1 Tax=Spirosoma sp. KCTC 42546 TaxID=2520506 RepID=UPI00143D624C|nr:hypothetical protein [Spirosoma sp. KCTC 42546]
MTAQTYNPVHSLTSAIRLKRKKLLMKQLIRLYLQDSNLKVRRANAKVEKDRLAQE